MRLEFPLIKRELIALLRTRRAFWLLILAVVGSTFITLLVWPSTGDTSVYHSRRVREAFMAFTMTQLSVALLVMPALTAGAISGERERGTYELLYTTLLSPFSIVLSKVAASSAFVFLMLIAAAPCLCVLLLLGGVDINVIGWAYLITFLAVLKTALVCLTTSMRSARTANAAVRGVLWTVVWNGGALVVGVLFVVIVRNMLGLRMTSPAPLLPLLIMSPYPALASLVEPFPGVSLFTLSMLYAGYAAAVSLGHFVYLLRAVRTPDVPRSRRRERALAAAARVAQPATAEQAVAPDGARRAGPAVRRSAFTRLLLDLGEAGVPGLRNPVFMKEVRSEFFGRLWYRRLCFWAPLVLLGLLSFVDDGLQGVAGPVMMIALGAAVVLLPPIIAVSVPREFEQGNMDLLRGTLLPLRSIADGKLLAGLYGMWGIVAAALLVLVVRPPFASVQNGYWYGTQPDYIEILFWLWVLVFTVLPMTYVFTATVANFFAVLVRRSLGAMLGAYATLLGLYLVWPIILDTVFRLRFNLRDDVLALAMNPFMLFGTSFFEYGRYADGHGAALLLFLVVHGVAAAVLWRLAGHLFERRQARDA